jgi:hypothetical protein
MPFLNQKVNRIFNEKMLAFGGKGVNLISSHCKLFCGKGWQHAMAK